MTITFSGGMTVTGGGFTAAGAPPVLSFTTPAALNGTTSQTSLFGIAVNSSGLFVAVG